MNFFVICHDQKYEIDARTSYQPSFIEENETLLTDSNHVILAGKYRMVLIAR